MSVSTLLSSDQLLAAVPGSSFFLYSAIAQFNNIDELLSTSPIQVVFLLYETQANTGHFCVVFRRPDRVIEWFDSYGYATDSELSFVSPQQRRILHEDRPLLLSLLVRGDQNDRWAWNSYDLQNHSPIDQTCGRWCVLRALHRDLTDDEFHSFMKLAARKTGGDLDKATVVLTEPLLHP
jgi:hypothetical protein